MYKWKTNTSVTPYNPKNQSCSPKINFLISLENASFIFGETFGYPSLYVDGLKLLLVTHYIQLNFSGFWPLSSSRTLSIRKVLIFPNAYCSTLVRLLACFFYSLASILEVWFVFFPVMSWLFYLRFLFKLFPFDSYPKSKLLFPSPIYSPTVRISLPFINF